MMHSFVVCVTLGCVWQGSGCGCGSSGCGCAGGADSVEELKPFYENVWQNSFSWLRNVDKKVKCPWCPPLFFLFIF
jgi:hypothetical protein